MKGRPTFHVPYLSNALKVVLQKMDPAASVQLANLPKKHSVLQVSGQRKLKKDCNPFTIGTQSGWRSYVLVYNKLLTMIGFTVVTFVTSKNLLVKSTKFP